MENFALLLLQLLQRPARAIAVVFPVTTAKFLKTRQLDAAQTTTFAEVNKKCILLKENMHGLLMKGGNETTAAGVALSTLGLFGAILFEISWRFAAIGAALMAAPVFLAFALSLFEIAHRKAIVILESAVPRKQ